MNLQKKGLIIFGCINLWSGLWGLAVLVLRLYKIISYSRIDNWQLFYISIVPLSVLSFLLIINSYGYFKRRIWAWYLTFPQIIISLLIFHPSFYVPIYIENLINSILLIYIIRIFCFIVELIKGVFFILPSTRNIFDTYNIIFWKKVVIIGSAVFCIITILILSLRINNILF